MAKRRPAGDGMVRKREDGRWEGRIVVGHKKNGDSIFRYISAPTQKELSAKLRQLTEAYKGVDLTEESNMALSVWLDKWLDEHTGPVFQNVLMTCAAFAGVALALFLFTFLPTFLTGQLIRFIPLGRWGRVILEGALKMAIFLLYMFLCTRMKELHRVFEYHGAEHKTIACYEAGLPLTVENIRKQSRFHPRCGTSFMILVIIISIFLYAVLPWTSTGLRIVYKLCMFPLLVGVCYEILKWAGRSHGVLSRIVSQPGLWMQRLTTFEPDDSMIEVAIAAVTPVLPENQEEARW